MAEPAHGEPPRHARPLPLQPAAIAPSGPHEPHSFHSTRVVEPPATRRYAQPKKQVLLMHARTAPGPPKNRNTGRLPEAHTGQYDWQLHAACRHISTDVFFHPENERGNARHHREQHAKRICAECPVLAECRAHALQVHEPYGVWGGLSEGERLQLHRA